MVAKARQGWAGAGGGSKVPRWETRSVASETVKHPSRAWMSRWVSAGPQGLGSVCVLISEGAWAPSAGPRQCPLHQGRSARARGGEGAGLCLVRGRWGRGGGVAALGIGIASSLSCRRPLWAGKCDGGEGGTGPVEGGERLEGSARGRREMVEAARTRWSTGWRKGFENRAGRGAETGALLWGPRAHSQHDGAWVRASSILSDPENPAEPACLESDPWQRSKMSTWQRSKMSPWQRSKMARRTEQERAAPPPRPAPG